MMRKIAVLCVFLVCCVFGVSAEDLDFTLVNEMGVDIYEVYLSPHVSDDWEEDILEGDVLADGDYFDITVAEDYTDKYWDMLCVDEDGDEHEFKMIDLFKYSFLTLRWSDTKGAYMDKE